MIRRSWIGLGLLALAACGDAQGQSNRGSAPQSNGSTFARQVATQEAANCTRAPAPTPAHAVHLRRLCACLEAKTAGSDLQPTDGQEAINARLRRFADECVAEVGDGSNLSLPADRQ